MPVFEYRCNKCLTVFDAFKHNHKDQNTNCPNCQNAVTEKERVMSVSNFNRIDIRCQRLFGHNLKGIYTSERHKA